MALPLLDTVSVPKFKQKKKEINVFQSQMSFVMQSPVP